MSAEQAFARMDRNQAIALLVYLKKYQQPQFSFAKSRGAYFCGTPVDADVENKMQNCIVYMDGMNPNIDEEYFDNSHREYGGDDFGERLDTANLVKFVNSNHTVFELELTPEQLNISFHGRMTPSRKKYEKENGDSLSKGCAALIDTFPK